MFMPDKVRLGEARTRKGLTVLLLMLLTIKGATSIACHGHSSGNECLNGIQTWI